MQNRYKYKDEPLTPSKAARLILTLFTGVMCIKKQYITAGVFQFHKSQGGLEDHRHPDQCVAGALSSLQDQGYAEPLGGGYWRILSIYDDDSES